MSKRIVAAVIAASVAGALAVVGTGVVAATAGHAPNARTHEGVIWTEMVPAKGVAFPN